MKLIPQNDHNLEAIFKNYKNHYNQLLPVNEWFVRSLVKMNKIISISLTNFFFQHFESLKILSFGLTKERNPNLLAKHT